MKPKELKEILEQHRLWLAGEGGQRANLRYANLRNTNPKEIQDVSRMAFYL